MNQLVQDSEEKPSNSVQNSEMPDLSGHLHYLVGSPWSQPPEHPDFPELRDLWLLPEQYGSPAAGRLIIEPSEGPDIDPNIKELTDSNEPTVENEVDETVSICLEDNIELPSPEVPGALFADPYEKTYAAAPAPLDVTPSWSSQMETQVARLCEDIEKIIINEVESHLSNIEMAFSANAINKLDTSEAKRRHCFFEDREGDLQVASSTGSRGKQLGAGSRGTGVCIESQLEQACLQVRQNRSEILHRSVKEQIHEVFRVGLLAHQKTNTHCEVARPEKVAEGSSSMKTVAGGKQSLICPYCKKPFQRKCNLKCVFQRKNTS